MKLFHARLLPGAMLLLFAGQTLACATCQCGDYTLTLLGDEKNFAGRLRLGVEALARREAAGEPGVDESVFDERRYSLGASYSFNDRLSLAARLPYVRKDWHVDGVGDQTVSGLGDADLTARYTLGQTGGAVVRQRWGVQAGMKLPTSSEKTDASGAALDIDGQPGAGAWTPSLGAYYGYFHFPWMTQISLVATDPHPGYGGFKGGRALVLAAQSQYALNTAWSLQLEFDLRHALRNLEAGERDADSGGTLGSIAPGIAWSPATDVVLYASGQIPVIRSYNGVQHESGAVRVGIAFDLPGLK